ncbi:related to fusarubin cluster - transcription factor [Fusarium torulosum]|uniref:Related to fusarubin cluster - transcription factor n=1 Tax=Fusarium torulosum TaxID=33205 RepID=A0AAE8SEJ1_9HYPO|nr:related to fusarubin cluster - transcription factor [Fusarium torulosum]
MMSNSFRTFNDISAQPATRPVRLRLACDACTTAKVRCSRTHPCERCEDNGQEKECYYSVSRRHGKRARHRKTESEMLRSSNTPSFSTSDFASAQYGTDFAWEDYSDTPGSSATKIDGEFEMLDSWASHSMDVTVDFDDININKTALGNLIPLLKCPCARNPHIAMLHSAILSKVIFWYRVAVTARYHSDGVELQPMKIQLGMLDLDDEDQATLQRALLLSELRKAEKILETFDSFSVREDGIPSWHASALRNMREELQVIIQKIKRGQRDLA